MKLRIKDNSIRLRLSQTEVQNLMNKGEVISTTHFGHRQLYYELTANGTEFTAQFVNDRISVNVPSSVADQWASSEEVGMATTISLPENNQLQVLIEKDFQCLIDRPNEDESNLYQNPLDKHSC